MSKIIRGTTPTITYTFKTVDLADLSKAILTIKKSEGSILVEKDLDAATVDDNKLSWTLSQTETLLVSGDAYMMVNWLTNSGVRGASAEVQVRFTPNHKDEVI